MTMLEGNTECLTTPLIRFCDVWHPTMVMRSFNQSAYSDQCPTRTRDFRSRPTADYMPRESAFDSDTTRKKRNAVA